MQIRLQSSAATTEVSLPSDATLGDLRAEVTSSLKLLAPDLRAGFPPALLTGDDSQELAQLLGGGGSARVIVSGGSAAAASSSSRRKQTNVVRNAAAAHPADAPARTGGDGTRTVGDGTRPEFSREKGSKRKGVKKGSTSDPLEDWEPEKLARVMQSERDAAGGSNHTSKRSKGGSDATSEKPKPPASKRAAAKPRAPKRHSIEEMATGYYCGPSSALALAARGGGGSGDFLSEHANIEYRLDAISSGRFVVAVSEGGQELQVTFRALRRDVCETVQALNKQELAEMVTRIGKRGGTSSRGRASSSRHLLTAREMSKRSPALFWSLAHEFDQNVERAVDQLLAEDGA